MATTYDRDATAVYAAARQFRDRCLSADLSLLCDEQLWTAENLQRLHEDFVSDPVNGKRSFTEKFREQVTKSGNPAIVRLAAEVVAVHFLFPSNVRGERKRALVAEILGWANERLPEDGTLSVAFETGVGSGGLGYNTRRPIEIGFLIAFALTWKRLAADQRSRALEDPWAFMAVVDEVDGSDGCQLRHMLVHLIFPESFERISSSGHKRRVDTAFSSMLGPDAPEDLDKRLLEIRRTLERLLVRSDLDFYLPPLDAVWSAPSMDADSDAIDALRHRRQIVLYGPPGTGKTHQAKQIAGQLIRQALLARWGPKEFFSNMATVEAQIERRVHRLQLHPAYGYEEFIRGLHIGASGATEYRPGYLMHLTETIAADDSAIPHVLILDEMNRTDLSRTLGEAFSLLEDRDQTIELPGLTSDGAAMTLRIPGNLYVIGTMNLIDQSVEQLDFALRRRFLWVRCGFDMDALVAVCRARWGPGVRRAGWEKVESDFRLLAAAALALNEEIRSSPLLGPQYEIGHAYLLDAVSYLKEDLSQFNSRSFLWKRDRPRRPIELTWRYALRPLISEYLAGLDARAREAELGTLEEVFMRRPISAD
jgi:5-methylcytosine-specific restriction protein B